MNAILKSCKGFFCPYPFIKIILILILIADTFHLFFQSDRFEDALVIWLLIALSSYDCFSRLHNFIDSSTTYFILPWTILSLSIMLMGYGIWTNTLFFKCLSLFFMVFACIARNNGLVLAVQTILPAMLGLVILPIYNSIILILSLPLRLISSQLTVLTLKVFDVDISCEYAVILLGKQAIAITDKCSGVSQLGVLFLIAYLLQRKTFVPFYMKLCWLLLLPLWVILANTVRLLATLGLYSIIGEKAFSYLPHVLLGIIFVILASLLMWWSFGLMHDSESKKC